MEKIRIAEKSLLDQFCAVLEPLQRYIFFGENSVFLLSDKFPIISSDEKRDRRCLQAPIELLHGSLQFTSNIIFNLFKGTKIISTFWFLKLKIKFLHMLFSSRTCFLFFLHFLALFLHFSFLFRDNSFLSFYSFKSLASLSIMHFSIIYYCILNVRRTGYKHQIIDKLINNKFLIFFTNSKLHSFNFLILLH